MLLFTLENLVDTVSPSARTATIAMTAMSASNRPYSTMLAPRSPSTRNLASSQVLRTNRSMCRLVERAVDRGELRGDAAPEGLHGDDGDDGDEGEQQAVLHHAGTGLVVGVELGLEPGLQNEKVHLNSPLCRRPRRFIFLGFRRP